jgi:PAS domain S-box-containing protein
MDETRRLAALNRYDVFDTAPEQEYDAIASLASLICHAPVATITFVGATRQSSKAAVGIEAADMPRDMAFSTHAICGKSVLIVADTTIDQRFKSHPLVAGAPHIRFYAGAPLLTLDGQAVGALNVLDYVPRNLSPEQVEGLTVLSRQIVSRLEFRVRFDEMQQTLAGTAGTLQQLFEGEAKYRALTETASDGIVTIDESMAILFSNDALGRMLGYETDELVGRSIQELIAGPFRESYRQSLRELIRQGEATGPRPRSELVMLHRDGGEITVEAACGVHRAEAGYVFSWFLRDIRERKRNEALLVEARETALAASRAKSDFLANMSHEIRTPMNGVVGMATLLLDTTLSPEQREYAESVRESAHSLMTIINDVLDFSKIEAGMLRIDPQPFNLRHTIDRVVALLAPSVRDKGVELAAHYTGDIPVEVVGDAGRVRQVLVNLIGNALKFTAKGYVHVEVFSDPPAAGFARVQIAVTDTGIGIPANKLESIFEEFVQGESSTTRRFGGTGLGLSISRRLVQLMGGTIAVTSEVNHGSTFTIELPLAVHEGAPASQPRVRATEGTASSALVGSVLVVEDVVINQRVAQGMLKKLGCEVDLACHGAEAVEKAMRRHYDLVLMDCHMPVMDGFQATGALRRLPGYDTVPIVAMTASALRSDRDQCLAAGMDAFLTKPVAAADLSQVLSRYLTRTAR